MSVKYIFNYLCYNLVNPKTYRHIYKMNLENDSEGIKAVLGRIEVIKKKLLALTDEVGHVQSALLKVQNKGRALPVSNSVRTFSTSAITKRKLMKLDDNLIDIPDSPSSIRKATKRKLAKLEDDLSDTLDSPSINSTGSLDMDENGYVVVYTDGACENNGKANAKAGYGVWFGENHPMNISEPVSGRATNNCGEIQACTAAINAARQANAEKIHIHTDSQFVINSMTKWIHSWKKNGWKTADGNQVKNKDDFVHLDQAVRNMHDVKWKYVPGHKGITGNCAADELARQGAARYHSK